MGFNSISKARRLAAAVDATELLPDFVWALRACHILGLIWSVIEQPVLDPATFVQPRL